MKRITLRFIFIFIFVGFYQNTFSQFVLNGSATQVSDSCFQITSAANWQSGSIWNEEKINLNESFSMTVNAFFGCADANGADGMVFAFQPVSTSQGSEGEGIGYQFITPSIGIEFDTWQNTNLNDPVFDHVAILTNGSVNHNSANTVAGPVQASPNSQNIEDCQEHQVRINWDVSTQTLDVYFDCELRLSYTADIVNEIFNGDPNVFWGYTSATGGANNRHEICLTEIKFVEPAEDVVICPGGQYQLLATGGDTYNWIPATGLNNPNVPNPIASPDASTTYIVEISNGNCTISQFDTIDVLVDGDTVFFDLGVDTLICEGSNYILDATSFGDLSVEYNWNTGASSATVQPNVPGLYAVTVTIDDFCVADDRVNINFINLPMVNSSLDTSLCLEDDFFVDVSQANIDDYLWNDGDSNPIQIITSAGNYSVQLFNICGSATQKFFVDFEDCTNVYAPNVFSPNSDGINEIFTIMDEGDVEIIHTMKIFNRWGGLVFEVSNFQPNDLSVGWNGFFKGEVAETGIYTWFAELRFRNGDEERMRGDVLLLR